MKNKLRLLLVCLVLSVLLVCTGCSGEVSVAKKEYSSDLYSYTVDIRLSKETVLFLEQGKDGGADKETVATSKPARTLSAYMKKLSLLCGVDLYEDKYADGAYYYTATLIGSDEIFAHTPSSNTYKKESGLFFNTYTVTMQNPFSNAFDLYGKENISYSRKDSLEYIVYLLSVGSTADELLPFHQYFAVDKSVSERVAFEFLLQRRMFMTAESEGIKILNGADYFCFPTSYLDADGTLTYTFKSVNSYVWYATFILVGIIVALVLYLVGKKSKAQPALKDETELEKKRLAFKKSGSLPRAYHQPTANPAPKSTSVNPFEEDEKEKSSSESKIDPFDEEK